MTNNVKIMNKNIIELEIIKHDGSYLTLTTDEITIERLEAELKKPDNYHPWMSSMEIIINNKLDVTDCTIKDIFNIVGLLEESHELEASIALMIDVRCDIKDYERQWENYIGFFDSEEEYCKDYIEQSDEIPDHYKFYIDYQRLARDVFCDLMPIYANCGVYVFHS